MERKKKPEFELSPFMDTFPANTGRLQNVKHFKLWPGHADGEMGHCPHFQFFDPALTLVTEPLLPLLENLQEGFLHCFTWDLVKCIPARILGPEGYLAHRQKNLEYLRLVTDPSCFCDDKEHIALSAFDNLTGLSLIGFSQWHELMLTLRKRGPYLKRFEFQASEYMEGMIDDEFLDMIREAAEDQSMPILSSLQRLILREISVSNGERDLVLMHACNWSVLRILKLRACRGWGSFLKGFVTSRQPINLDTLEIVAHEAEDKDADASALAGFLTAFKGLENLYLAVGEKSHARLIWESCLNHTATLKTLYVNRGPLGLDAPVEVDTFDNLPTAVVSVFDDPQSPALNLNLEYFGLCALQCDMESLHTIFRSFVGKNCLKVIHLNQTIEELMRSNGVSWAIKYDSLPPPIPQSGPSSEDELSPGIQAFAEWAFGASGIASLEVIAFGDHSYWDRYGDVINVLCRNTDAEESNVADEKAEDHGRRSWRFQELTDERQWDLLLKHVDALMACPLEPFLVDTR